MTFRPHQVIVLALVLLNTWLASWLLGLTSASILLNTAAILCLSLVTLNQVERLRCYNCMDILIVSLAMLSGTLLGIYADFGRYGLLTAIQICQSNDQFIQTLRIAPWTHLGMLLACSAAIMFVQKDAFSTKGCAQHLCCLVAMFVGMWLIKIVPSDAFLTTSQSGIIASLVPLTYMWLAMSLAMATFFLITNMGKPYQPKEDTKND